MSENPFLSPQDNPFPQQRYEAFLDGNLQSDVEMIHALRQLWAKGFPVRGHWWCDIETSGMIIGPSSEQGPPGSPVAQCQNDYHDADCILEVQEFIVASHNNLLRLLDLADRGIGGDVADRATEPLWATYQAEGDRLRHALAVIRDMAKGMAQQNPIYRPADVLGVAMAALGEAE